MQPPPASRENKDRLARLLHAGRSLTLDDVAATLGVTERTARRTLRALEAEGLPIRTRFVDGHKLHHLETGHRDAPLEPITFSEREALALSLATVVATTALQPTPLADALASARARLIRSADIVVLEAGGVPGGEPVDRVDISSVRPEVFEAAHRAVVERRSLTVSYVDAQGQRGWGRVIDPYMIAAVGGAWLVIARDHRHGHVVHFALATIEEAVVGEPFQEIP